jgi:hypothetical protein
MYNQPLTPSYICAYSIPGPGGDCHSHARAGHCHVQALVGNTHHPLKPHHNQTAIAAINQAIHGLYTCSNPLHASAAQSHKQSKRMCQPAPTTRCLGCGQCRLQATANVSQCDRVSIEPAPSQSNAPNSKANNAPDKKQIHSQRPQRTHEDRSWRMHAVQSTPAQNTYASQTTARVSHNTNIGINDAGITSPNGPQQPCCVFQQQY